MTEYSIQNGSLNEKFACKRFSFLLSISIESNWICKEIVTNVNIIVLAVKALGWRHAQDEDNFPIAQNVDIDDIHIEWRSEYTYQQFYFYSKIHSIELIIISIFWCVFLPWFRFLPTHQINKILFERTSELQIQWISIYFHWIWFSFNHFTCDVKSMKKIINKEKLCHQNFSIRLIEPSCVLHLHVCIKFF